MPWIPTSAPLPGQGMEGKWCKFLGAWGSSQDCPSRGLWVWGEVNGFLWVPGSRHLSRVCLWSSVDIYQTCHLLRILRGPCQAPHVAVQVPEDSHVSQCELGCLLGPFVPLPSPHVRARYVSVNHKLPSRAHRATGHTLGFQDHPPCPSKTHSHGEKATQTPRQQPESLAHRKTQPWGSQGSLLPLPPPTPGSPEVKVGLCAVSVLLS